MCSLSRVTSTGESTLFLPSGAARVTLRFQRYGMFKVDPVENHGATSLDIAQAPLCAPSPFCPPPVQQAEEPAAHDGVDLDVAAFCRAAAGLVLNECSGWSGRGRGRDDREAAGAAQGVEMRAISSCVSGRSMVSPGRHQAGRCKRMPHGSSWWERMCSNRARFFFFDT